VVDSDGAHLRAFKAFLAHLGRHGVEAKARKLDSGGLAVGDVLLNLVADEGIDLVVMGAYGHSRMRELMLGGATRTLVRQMTAPTLFSH
jgi:nucleotide-binding universal stress UspA family protein